MIYLFDTSAVSDHMAAHPTLVARLAQLSSATDRAVTSAIVRGEILFGLARLQAGKRRDDLSAKAIATLSALHCESVSERIADRYAVVKDECPRSGSPLSENDFWIAATALELSAILVTRDSDFRRVRGLSVEDSTV
jgi:predicted nucleic acid-binding protein